MQIMIMFLIAAWARRLGTFSVVLLCYRRMFNSDHRFLPGRLWKVE